MSLRSITLAIIVIAAIFTFTFGMYMHVEKAAALTERIHEGDLIVKNGTFTIADSNFTVNGNIYVMKDAVLVIENSILIVNQTEDLEHVIKVNETARIEIVNSNVCTSVGSIQMIITDNASATISSSKISNDTMIECRVNSTITVSSSKIASLTIADNSTGMLNGAEITEKLEIYGICSVNMTSTHIAYIEVSGRCEVRALNSYINSTSVSGESLLNATATILNNVSIDNAATLYAKGCSLNRTFVRGKSSCVFNSSQVETLEATGVSNVKLIKSHVNEALLKVVGHFTVKNLPKMAKLWGSSINGSIFYSLNITLINSTISSYKVHACEGSIVEISNADMDILKAYSGSTVYLNFSRVDEAIVGSSIVKLMHSTIDKLEAKGSGRIHIYGESIVNEMSVKDSCLTLDGEQSSKIKDLVIENSTLIIARMPSIDSISKVSSFLFRQITISCMKEEVTFSNVNITIIDESLGTIAKYSVNETGYATVLLDFTDTSKTYVLIAHSGRSFIKLTLAFDCLHMITLNFSQFSIDDSPPSIQAPSIEPMEPSDVQAVSVKVTVSDNLYVEKVYLFFRFDGSSWKCIELKRAGDLFEGYIPSLPAGSKVEFYIVAYDILGNKAVNDNDGKYFTYTVKYSSTSFHISLIGIVLALMAIAIVYVVWKKRNLLLR